MTPSSDARSVLSSKVTKSYSWRTLMILLLSVHIVRLWTVFVILFLPVLTVLLMEWFKPIWAANLNAICWLALLLSHRNTMSKIFSELGDLPLSTFLPPHTRLSKDDCDPAPERGFHLRYRDSVGSLTYLVNMTRPDLTPNSANSFNTLTRLVWPSLITLFGTSVTLSSVTLLISLYTSLVITSDNCLLSYQETQYGQQIWNSDTRTMKLRVGSLSYEH